MILGKRHYLAKELLNTNGIIIQRGGTTTKTDVNVRLKRTKKRSFHPPNTELVPLQGKWKSDPQTFQSIQKEGVLDPSQDDPRKFDLAYILARMPTKCHDKLLPLWTGFNSMMCTNIPPVSSIGYLPIMDRIL